MSSIDVTPLNLGIAQKLKEKAYRDRFFLGMAKDEIAMMLREARETRGMRQIDLARATGMKQSAVSRLEQAGYSAWSFGTLMRIAAALDIRVKFECEMAEDVIARYEAAEAERKETDRSRQKIPFFELSRFDEINRGDILSGLQRELAETPWPPNVAMAHLTMRSEELSHASTAHSLQPRSASDLGHEGWRKFVSSARR